MSVLLVADRSHTIQLGQQVADELIAKSALSGPRLRTELLSGPALSHLLHSKGINVRHLGLIRNLVLTRHQSMYAYQW